MTTLCMGLDSLHYYVNVSISADIHTSKLFDDGRHTRSTLNLRRSFQTCNFFNNGMHKPTQKQVCTHTNTSIHKIIQAVRTSIFYLNENLPLKIR